MRDPRPEVHLIPEHLWGDVPPLGVVEGPAAGAECRRAVIIGLAIGYKTDGTPFPLLYKLRPFPSYSGRRDLINLVLNFMRHQM